MSFGQHFMGQMTAGRCHTLLSPVTEESGEEGTNSEISSPPACRSPSPVANTEASVNQVPPTWHCSKISEGMQDSILCSHWIVGVRFWTSRNTPLSAIVARTLIVM